MKRGDLGEDVQQCPVVDWFLVHCGEEASEQFPGF